MADIVATRRVTRKRSITPMPKALDYAYACQNGILKCFNTHGLPYTQFNEWDVVHNMNNCQGTAVPDCSGNGPWWGTGAGSSEKNPTTTPAPYDYVVAQRTGKNRIDLFGVIVKNDETEDYYPLNKTQFSGLTGQNTVILTGNRRVYRPYYLTGSKLFDYNSKVYKVASKGISDAKSFMKSLGQDSLLFFTEFLDFNGVPVKDGNDIAEVLTKYIAFQNPNFAEINLDYANAVNRFYQARSIGDFVPVEKSMDIGGFDIGGIISGAVSFIMDMINAGEQEATRRELIQWLNWFNNQMQIDYNDLITFHAEKGPRFAADYITRLEGSSWSDIRNYITRWCGQKAVPVPPEIKTVFDNFAALKVQWIREANNPGSDPDYTPEPTDPANHPPSESSMGVGTVLGLGLAAVVLFKLFS